MGIFKKVEETKSGLKVLAYGGTGTGKTTFALTFPEIAAIDSEDGMAFYKNNPNLKHILNTTSADEVEEALEEIEDELLDEIKTFVLDSETKIYENLQLSGLNVAEKRARRKGESVEDANISQREWGKIKLLVKKAQSIKIMLASKGINIVSIAQQKDIKEKKGDNWVVVGYAPDVSKGLEFDYDIILRFFTEKNKDGEEVYKAEVLKDRTQTYKKNQVIENPSFENWKHVYDKSSTLKERVIDFKKDIEKDEAKMISESEQADELVAEFKKLMKSLSDSEAKLKVNKKVKELDLDVRNLAMSDVDKLQELVEFTEGLAESPVKH
jgi:hypothetical protein